MQNGEFYEGHFRNNQKSGHGSQTYQNGDVYEGEWQNDRRFGKGKISQKDGALLEATFVEDVAQGPNTVFTDKHGNVF